MTTPNKYKYAWMIIIVLSICCFACAPKTYQMGKQSLDDGDYEKAAEELAQFVESNPDAPELTAAKMGMAWALYKSENYDLAADIYKDAMVLQEPVERPYTKFLIALCYLRAKKYPLAGSYFAQVSKKAISDELSAMAYYGHAKTQFLMQRWSNASPLYLSYLDIVGQEGKYAALAKHRLEECFTKQGDWIAAAEFLQKELETIQDKDKKLELQLRVFDYYKKGKDYTQAEKVASSILDEFMGSEGLPSVAWWLANFKDSREQTEAAYHVFQTIVSQYPSSRWAPGAYFWLAQYMEGKGETRETDKYYKLIVEKYPQSNWASIAQTWLDSHQF